jgi:DNA end-binding protein Ku
MGARATGSGTISIGLVTIPVKLYTATSAKGVSFNELHACGDGKYSRTKPQLRCAAEDKVIERSELVKGLEVSPDQYAIFTTKELEALKAARPSTLHVSSFVPAASIDSIYVEKTSFLGPDTNGAKGYAWLRALLKKHRRVARGTFASRSGKDVLVIVRPYENGLALQELFYGDEVRSIGDIEGLDALPEPSVRELRLGGQFVAQMAGKFEPEKYFDTWAAKVKGIAATKLAGGEVAMPEPPADREPVSELADALERSLAQSGPRKASPRRGRAA